MKKLLSVAAICAALLATATTGTAHAASTKTLECTTAGARGEIIVKGHTSTHATLDLEIAVWDMNADGHHVRIRFMSESSAAERHLWGWREFHGGSGKGRAWYTTAKHSSGIDKVGIQVGRFDGDRMLNSCTKWID